MFSFDTRDKITDVHSEKGWRKIERIREIERERERERERESIPPLILDGIHNVSDDAEDVEAGEDRLGQVDVLGKSARWVVAATNRIRRRNNSASRLKYTHSNQTLLKRKVQQDERNKIPQMHNPVNSCVNIICHGSILFLATNVFLYNRIR